MIILYLSILLLGFLSGILYANNFNKTKKQKKDTEESFEENELLNFKQFKKDKLKNKRSKKNVNPQEKLKQEILNNLDDENWELGLCSIKHKTKDIEISVFIVTGNVDLYQPKLSNFSFLETEKKTISSFYTKLKENRDAETIRWTLL